jgi:hypothetical protein
MRGCDRTRPDCDIELIPIVRLAHYRIDRADILHSLLAQHPLGHRIRSFPDAEGAGEKDRSLKLAELIDLRRAEQFSKTVADDNGGGNSLQKEVTRMRENRGDAGPDRIALDYRNLPDQNSRDISDAIQRARRKNTRRDSELTRAGTGLRDRRRGLGNSHGKTGYEDPQGSCLLVVV